MFQVVSVVPRPDKFEFVPTAEYRVNVAAEVVEETRVDDADSTADGRTTFALYEGVRPGSYAPLTQ
jgi:hypothetical protein